MSINLSGRIVADPQAGQVHGIAGAGVFVLSFGVNFAVSNWSPAEKTPAPTVSLAPAPVYVESGGRILAIGHAIPEMSVPFRLADFSFTSGLQFSLTVSQSVMEAIEGLRNGGGVTFRLKVKALLTTPRGLDESHEDVLFRASQSDWIEVLKSTGYGQVLLFEIPVPSASTDASQPAQMHLAKARNQLLAGNYTEVVSACRMALEGFTHQRGEEDAVRDAREQVKRDSRALTLYQRELLVRNAAINLANVAHHVDNVTVNETFDRETATMMLGVTAAILSRKG